MIGLIYDLATIIFAITVIAAVRFCCKALLVLAKAVAEVKD